MKKYFVIGSVVVWSLIFGVFAADGGEKLSSPKIAAGQENTQEISFQIRSFLPQSVLSEKRIKGLADLFVRSVDWGKVTTEEGMPPAIVNFSVLQPREQSSELIVGFDGATGARLSLVKLSDDSLIELSWRIVDGSFNLGTLDFGDFDGNGAQELMTDFPGGSRCYSGISFYMIEKNQLVEIFNPHPPEDRRCALGGNWFSYYPRTDGGKGVVFVGSASAREGDPIPKVAWFEDGRLVEKPYTTPIPGFREGKPTKPFSGFMQVKELVSFLGDLRIRQKELVLRSHISRTPFNGN